MAAAVLHLQRCLTGIELSGAPRAQRRRGSAHLLASCIAQAVEAEFSLLSRRGWRVGAACMLDRNKRYIAASCTCRTLQVKPSDSRRDEI